MSVEAIFYEDVSQKQIFGLTYFTIHFAIKGGPYATSRLSVDYR